MSIDFLYFFFTVSEINLTEEGKKLSISQIRIFHTICMLIKKNKLSVQSIHRKISHQNWTKNKISEFIIYLFHLTMRDNIDTFIKAKLIC
jgi:hypothetical protein